MGNFAQETWEVHPVLDVPALFPPAIMFTVRDSDPRPHYQEELRKGVELQAERSAEIPGSITPEVRRLALLTVAWDSTFREVPGHRMALLYGGREEGPAYMVMLKSNEPPGLKWLTTRATQLDGKPVCWCVPVQVERGKRVEVTLTLSNMTTLELS